MAEMLIDGAKLDACNTAEADAIRAKTGGSSPIPYDFANNKGFADAIAAIPSGTTLPFLQSYEVVTIATDMTTTAAGGNTQSFQNTYLPSVSEKPYPTVLILIENTFTGTYAACGAIRLSSLDRNSPNSATTRLYLRAEGTVNIGNQMAFYIGAGSKLHIFTFRGETE